jgi:hypothetical protein
LSAGLSSAECVACLHTDSLRNANANTYTYTYIHSHTDFNSAAYSYTKADPNTESSSHSASAAVGRWNGRRGDSSTRWLLRWNALSQRIETRHCGFAA